MRCKIDDIIKDKGLKKKYVAEAVGISATQLSHWLAQRSYPPADKLFKLADILGVTVNDLYEYESKK